MDPAKSFGVAGQVSKTASQDGSRTDHIPVSMVIKRDRNLNQALQKLLLRSGRGSPDVLQRLMGVKKLAVIEQFQPVIRSSESTDGILTQAVFGAEADKGGPFV